MVRWLLVLAACGSAPPPPHALASQGSGSAPCDLPARIDIAARRYANVDDDDPSYGKWTAWQIVLDLAEDDRRAVTGKLAMRGDHYDWHFSVHGKLDRATCALSLVAATHDPTWIDLRVRGPISGTIKTIDDHWRIGEPGGVP